MRLPHIAWLTSLLLGALSFPGTAQQTVWTVGYGGVSTIQQAVDAASPGDAIFVIGQSGLSYAGATITKGVSLLGQGQVTLSSELVITGIPAGQHVVVKKFKLEENTATSGCLPIRCSDSQGTIHFEQVQTCGSMHGPALSVDRCVHVSALDCTLNAGATFLFPIPVRLLGSDIGISATQSGVYLTRCSFLGTPVQGNPPGYITTWIAGMTVDASRVVLTDCTGSGFAPFPCYGYPQCMFFPMWPGQAAVTATNGSTLVIKGGTYQFGVSADPATVIVQDANTPLTVTGGQLQAQPLHKLETAGAAPGQSFSVTLSSDVAGPLPYAVWASLPDRPILTPQSIWLSLAAPVQIFAGSFSGSINNSATVPAAFPLGFPIALQAVLLVNGHLELSTPVALVLY